MCRVDDDFDWLVGAKVMRVVEPGAKVQCEDCCRILEAGETYEDLMEDDEHRSDDDRAMVLVASHGGSWYDPESRGFARWAQPSYDIVGPAATDNDDDAWDLFISTFEALGFSVDEERDPRVVLPEAWHTWCMQCRAANEWLVKVCDQSMVLAACHDISDHLDEYSLNELGLSFGRLAVLAKRKWRTHRGALVDVATIETLTARAVGDAERAAGLVEAA